MKKHISSLRAFTLVELMVVIAIIAILTGIVMTSATAARARARDAKRISDLGQIQLGLEVFYDRCKEYPSAPLAVTPGADYICSRNASVKLSTYLPKMPIPASGTTYDYRVYDQTVGASPIIRNDYFLHVNLETANEVVKDAMPSVPSTWYNPTNFPYDTGPSLMVCSNDPTLKQYCINPN